MTKKIPHNAGSLWRSLNYFLIGADADGAAAGAASALAGAAEAAFFAAGAFSALASLAALAGLDAAGAVAEAAAGATAGVDADAAGVAAIAVAETSARIETAIRLVSWFMFFFNELSLSEKYTQLILCIHI